MNPRNDPDWQCMCPEFELDARTLVIDIPSDHGGTCECGHAYSDHGPNGGPCTEPRNAGVPRRFQVEA